MTVKKPTKARTPKPVSPAPAEAPETPAVEIVLTPEEKKETTEIAKVIVEAKSVQEAVDTFTPGQIALVKRLVAKDATDDELMLFIAVCKGAGLNPFLKQVYYVKRWDSEAGEMRGAIQVGIDGFRTIAEGTGAYAGNGDPIFDGEEESSWSTKKASGKFKHPVRATVTVRKVVQGVAYDFTATARWSEFYPGDPQGFMWRNKPHVMLGKCAEGQALRKAFPKQLSGLYTPEEMDQAGKPGKPDTALESTFQKAERMIGKIKDAGGLDNMKAILKASDKYTEGQKETLMFLIDERIGVLNNTQDEQPAAPEEVPTLPQA